MDLKEDDFDILLTGFDEDDLKTLDIDLDSVMEGEREGKEDQVPETPNQESVIKRGDLVELNGHRLLCGDSTRGEDVARLLDGKVAGLLFTAVLNYVMRGAASIKENGSKGWTDTYCPENEDNLKPEKHLDFLVTVIANAKRHLMEFAHYYIWIATAYLPQLFQAMEVNDVPCDKVPIIWKKQTKPVSWAHYKRVYEPCLFGGKNATVGSPQNSRWFGPNNEVSVWEIDADWNNSYVHPTQKPVALPERAIKNSSLPDEIVLDLFGGSGSTLIGCEKTRRKGYIMEKSEYYCQVIIERWYGFTNTKEIKVNGQAVNWDKYKESIPLES